MERSTVTTPPPGFYNTAQWSKRIKRSENATRRLLTQAVKDGEGERVVVMTEVTGKTCALGYYRIKGLQ